MGTPVFAVNILETLIKNVEVVMVISKKDAYVGRKKVLTPSPVKEVALKNNIPVITPERLKDASATIKELKPDLIVTCAYGIIVPKEILDIPKLGCINVHASLLPKYRGGAPIHHAIIDGESKTGVTIMYMDEGMDTGDIITMKSIDIEDTDNVSTMHEKLSLLGADLLKETLPSIINKTNPRTPQDKNLATYAPVIKREMEHLDFNKSSKEIFNKVRGLNSFPLANIFIDEIEFKIFEGYIGEDTNKEPGTIVNIKKDAIGVSCQDKVYYITKLKQAGKKVMVVRDYLNGISKEDLLNKKVK